MQFKKGSPDRRVPEFEHVEPAPEMDTPMASADQQRSPFSFSRGSASSTPTESREVENRAPAPTETPVAPPAPAARIESLVDGNASFEGHFKAEQDLRIQGSITGEITCRGLLTIERTATARAKIDAHDLEVHGTVEGDVTCSGRLRLAGSAVISGTVKAGSLVVEEGASINGAVEANFSGEGGVATPVRRRSSRSKNEDDSDNSDEQPSTSSRKSRNRDLPSFALVSSDDEPQGMNRGAGASS